MALAYILFLVKCITNCRNEKDIFVFRVSSELWCWIKKKTNLLLKDLTLHFGVGGGSRTQLKKWAWVLSVAGMRHSSKAQRYSVA